MSQKHQKTQKQTKEVQFLTLDGKALKVFVSYCPKENTVLAQYTDPNGGDYRGGNNINKIDNIETIDNNTSNTYTETPYGGFGATHESDPPTGGQHANASVCVDSETKLDRDSTQVDRSPISENLSVGESLKTILEKFKVERKGRTIDGIFCGWKGADKDVSEWNTNDLIRFFGLAYTRRWGEEGSPNVRTVTKRDRGNMKLLLTKYYSPEQVVDMITVLVSGWEAGKSQHNFKAFRPNIWTLFTYRDTIAAVKSSGGFRTRTHRASSFEGSGLVEL